MVTQRMVLQETEVPVTAIRPVVNVAKVRQLSPLRYPGGKTWLVPEIRDWLRRLERKPRLFVEPFAGGGIASLTAVAYDHTDQAVMAELDKRVAALWRCVLNDADWLIQRILEFDPDRDQIISVLERRCTSSRDIAFQTLIRNRTQRGGILANGAGLMKNGENGKGVASRWYPETLADRIARIQKYRHRIEFVEGDGFDLIERHKCDPDAVFFIDPPYTASTKRAGRRLYTHNVIDHDALFDAMAAIQGKFLMTYDADVRIEAMAAARGFNIERVAMKNTHHNQMVEFLITSSINQV